MYAGLAETEGKTRNCVNLSAVWDGQDGRAPRGLALGCERGLVHLRLALLPGALQPIAERDAYHRETGNGEAADDIDGIVNAGEYAGVADEEGQQGEEDAGGLVDGKHQAGADGAEDGVVGGEAVVVRVLDERDEVVDDEGAGVEVQQPRQLGQQHGQRGGDDRASKKLPPLFTARQPGEHNQADEDDDDVQVISGVRDDGRHRVEDTRSAHFCPAWRFRNRLSRRTTKDTNGTKLHEMVRAVRGSSPSLQYKSSP